MYHARPRVCAQSCVMPVHMYAYAVASPSAERSQQCKLPLSDRPARARDARQILSLMGIKYLYSLHVFLYSMFAFVLLALVWLLVAPAAKWKRLTKDEKLEAAYAT